MDHDEMMELLDEYKRERPFAVRHIVGCRPGRDNMEIVVEWDDGSRDIFDSVFKTTRTIRPDTDIDNLPTLSETRWRIEFGRRLYRVMCACGMKQWELAKLSGTSEQTISKYVNGESTPSAYAVYRLAKALECTIDYLVNFERIYEL